MIKLIEPSWDFGDRMTSIVEYHSRGVDSSWLQKRAACFTRRDLDDVERLKDHTYLHIVALGDSDYHGPNANGDAFTEKGGNYKAANGIDIPISVGNVQTHPTFVQNGRVYRDHKNTDPRLSYGPIVKSAHNDKMKRVELVIAIPNREFAEDLHELEKGGTLGWSMAAKVSRDICSVCGNKALTRDDYCDHARNHLTKITKSGHQVFVYNDGMNFFDLSRVRRPADRIALTFQKLAGTDVPIAGGAELASRLGLTTPLWMVPELNYKYASLIELAKKLATIEKDIPVEVSSAEAAAAKRCPLSESEMCAMRSEPSDLMLSELSRRKICISLPDFVTLMTGKPPAEDVASEATAALPSIFNRLLDEDAIGDAAYVSDACGAMRRTPGRDVMKLLSQLAERLSIDEAPARRRMMLITIRKVSDPVKIAASKPLVSPAARKLAFAYAGYQLGIVNRHRADELLPRLVILGNVLQE